MCFTRSAASFVLVILEDQCSYRPIVTAVKNWQSRRGPKVPSVRHERHVNEIAVAAKAKGSGRVAVST